MRNCSVIGNIVGDLTAAVPHSKLPIYANFRENHGDGFLDTTGWLALDATALGSALALGFALSLHKAQGSELDEVLLLLPDFPRPLARRNTCVPR